MTTENYLQLLITSVECLEALDCEANRELLAHSLKAAKEHLEEIKSLKDPDIELFTRP